MYEMVAGRRKEARDNKLVPAAVIDTGPVLTHDPVVLVTLLWVRGRLPGRAHSPPGADEKALSRQKVREEYEEFSHRKAVQEVLAEMKRADFLFTSLGCLKVDPLMKTRRAHRYMLENLKLTEAALLKKARSATSTTHFCRRRDDGARMEYFSGAGRGAGPGDGESPKDGGGGGGPL